MSEQLFIQSPRSYATVMVSTKWPKFVAAALPLLVAMDLAEGQVLIGTATRGDNITIAWAITWDSEAVLHKRITLELSDGVNTVASVSRTRVDATDGTTIPDEYKYNIQNEIYINSIGSLVDVARFNAVLDGMQNAGNLTALSVENSQYINYAYTQPEEESEFPRYVNAGWVAGTDVWYTGGTFQGGSWQDGDVRGFAYSNEFKPGSNIVVGWPDGYTVEGEVPYSQLTIILSPFPDLSNALTYRDQADGWYATDFTGSGANSGIIIRKIVSEQSNEAEYESDGNVDLSLSITRDMGGDNITWEVIDRATSTVSQTVGSNNGGYSGGYSMYIHVIVEVTNAVDELTSPTLVRIPLNDSGIVQ